MKLPAAYAAPSPPLTATTISFLPPDGIIMPAPPLPAALRNLVRQYEPEADHAPAVLVGDAPTQKMTFAVFTANFVHLQTSTSESMKLPIITNDFTSKYGSFSKEKEVTNCVEALKSLHTLCRKFGDPATLSKSIAELAQGSKPAQLYGQIVWLAQRISDAADTFHLTLKILHKKLPDIKSNAERKEILQELLMGEDGLVSVAKTMQKEAATLQKSLNDYKGEMVTLQEPIATYCSPKSAIYKEAEEKNADLARLVQDTQAKLDAARKEYTDYVISASSVSVGLFLLSGGMLWPLSATAGGILGALAEKARKHANALEKELATQQGLGRQKALLMTDLGGLDRAVKPVDKYLTEVCRGLGQVADTWGTVAETLTQLVNNTSPEVLADLSAFDQRSAILDGQNKWQLTAEITADFITKAFVQVA